MKHIFLPGLTTTSKSDWREKIGEIEKFNIKEIALFPTFLEIEDRKELYALLEKTGIKNIPHVHLREDMEDWELDFFCEKYGAQVFNVHPVDNIIDFLNRSKYKNIIFIENTGRTLSKNLEKYFNLSAGMCLDVSHWEDEVAIQKSENWENLDRLSKKYKIGCCHVSAINKNVQLDKNCITGKEEKLFSKHWVDNLSEVDYFKKYVVYLPKYVSIELENSFKDQLEVIKYLEKIINNE